MTQETNTLPNELICSALGIPTYDEWVQENDALVFDMALENVRDRFDPDSEESQTLLDNECERLWGLLTRDYDIAVADTLDRVGGYYGIKFFPVLGDFAKGWEVVIDDPEKTAAAVVEVINGYGLFHFGSVEELISSGPYADATDAVLKHIHWIAEHGNVFGEDGPRQVWERSFERSTRRW